MRGLSLALWTLAFASVAGAQEAPAPADDDLIPGLAELPVVVAEVDGYRISRRELIRELLGSSGSEALDRIIRRMLVEQAAEKAGVGVSEEELNAQLLVDYHRLQNEVEYAPWAEGEKTFAALVKARYQMTVEEYKRQVVRQKLLAKKMAGRHANVTEEDLRNFYERNADLFQPLDRYRAAHILVTPLTRQDLLGGNGGLAFRERIAEDRKAMERWRNDHGVDMADAPAVDNAPAWDHALERAKKVLDDLRARRIGWNEAVARYSQDPLDQQDPAEPELTVRQARAKQQRKLGRPPIPELPGEVGWFTSQGPMVPEFYRGAREIKIGPLEFSEPLRTRYGYHIVRMLEVKAAKRKPYAEVRDLVERTFETYVLGAHAEKWVEDLVAQADLQNTKALLWPPAPGAAGKTPEERDPVVGKVNGEPLHRGEVWKELLRSDGPDALKRLINREMALGPLKRFGPARMEWYSTPSRSEEGVPLRTQEPPLLEPIEVTQEEIELELNDDRLGRDDENEQRAKRQPPLPALSLEEYVYGHYGQSMDDYRRSLGAGLVISKAVKNRLNLDEATLVMEYGLMKKDMELALARLLKFAPDPHKVRPERVIAYYEPVRFEADQIFVSVPPNSDADRQKAGLEMAESARADVLAAPALWNKLAGMMQHKDVSDPEGQLGTLTHKDQGWRAELYAALREGNFEKGQLTQPIRTREGYHVVRIRLRVTGRIPEFGEIKRRLERDFLKARASLFMNTWVLAMEKQAIVKRFLFQIDKIEDPKLKVQGTLDLPKE
ncbi:MAG: peptidyl-prolyl cis-trans isomerase [Planctomycetota bacterium]|nr:peptidyl-prolyl cis-trans isomerase [Planctomycetota bacterium]